MNSTSASAPTRLSTAWSLLPHLVAAALAVALGAPSAAAQDAATTATVTGQVRDVSTNAPVVNAAVLIPALGRTAFTNGSGHFRLDGVPVGNHAWRVVALGYSTLNQEMEIADGDHLVIGMMPRPVALETLEVETDRLERMFRTRRNAAFRSLRILGPEEMRRSGGHSAESLVAARIAAAPCVSYGLFAENECVYRRGAAVPVRVYVDQVPLGGLIELRGFFATEIYAIEIWDHGTSVRVFTNRFAERLARGQVRF